MSHCQGSCIAAAAYVAALRIGKIMLAAALCIGGLAPVVAQADTCYRDDSGRIVTRRRPGYVEVPCPAPQAPANANGTENANGTANGAPAVPGTTAAQQEGQERGPPPSASPLNR